jgi:integrase
MHPDMNIATPTTVTLFRPEGVIMLADVRALADSRLDGNERRDVLSAFNVLRTRGGIELETTPASARMVRELFGALRPATLGVGNKRYVNIRSLVIRAVERFGMTHTRLSTQVSLTPEWDALLQLVGDRHYRQGVKRLAHYCSALDIPPSDVRSDCLVGLHEALDNECMTKHPRKVIKLTIGMWNHFGRTIPGWPSAILASPFRSEPDTLPLDRFPESFRADVERWTGRVSKPNPLDFDAPIRPLKPATIDGYIVYFRRFGSSLVRRGILPIEAVTSLSVFFEGTHFRDGLRHFLPAETRPDDPGTATAFRIARALRNVARHFVRVEASMQKDIDLICRRLDPQQPRTMGKRNLDRLEQFDDPENVRRLLTFPEEEAGRALRKANPFRRAKGIERALAGSMLIFTGLRIKNLRHIRLSDIRRVHGRAVLKVDAAEVKNGQALEFELQPETLSLLDRFLADHRSHLPGCGGPYLFPGQSGGPKSDNAMREAVSVQLRKHGITLSPHLYRHIIAKIVVERDPGMYIAVSRHLGHRSMTTTLGSYLGTETRAASRRLNRLLVEARDSPDPEGD